MVVFLLYVKESFQSCSLQSLINDDFQDSVWCKIDLEDHPVIVGVCYRSTSSTKENNDSLLQVLDKAVSQNVQSRLLIFGDFNYPEIDYDKFAVEGSTDSDAYRFFNKTNDLFLTKMLIIGLDADLVSSPVFLTTFSQTKVTWWKT